MPSTPIANAASVDDLIFELNEDTRFMNLVKEKEDSEGYITIEGHRHVEDKICAMLSKVEMRLYLSLSACYIEKYLPQLEKLSI